ncbi:MAG: SDR family oxidoreductase [Acidobacteriota bacterium]
MRSFSGKNVLITGGASGIGLATAEELIRKGANIMIFDYNPEAIKNALVHLKDLSIEKEVSCVAIEGDVTDFKSIKKAVDDMEERGNPVDILITSAGIAHPGAVFDLDPDIIKKTIDIDLLGTIYACRAVLPGMIARGGSCHIALISSVAGFLGVYGYSAYGAAKFGVRGLGEVLLQELKPYKIPVTILFPPDTDTPQLAYENKFKPEATKAISGTIKPVSPKYVAECLIKGIQKGKFQVIPTFSGKMTYFLSKFLGPVLRWFLANTVMKVEKKI